MAFQSIRCEFQKWVVSDFARQAFRALRPYRSRSFLRFASLFSLGFPIPFSLSCDTSPASDVNSILLLLRWENLDRMPTPAAGSLQHSGGVEMQISNFSADAGT
jgi:hypothetical protein